MNTFRINKRLFSALLTLLFAAPLVCLPVRALDSDDSQPLNLLPEPKEMRQRAGEFRLGPKTKILVQLGHQEEDRIAAETLAEEVSDQSGLRLDIIGTKVSSKAEGGVIMLVRLQDARVRRFLARKGLSADAAVGKEGYLLFSDHSHLIVAANTGEGLFSGVQTLRQLLRPEGKRLICPAVRIRDWPNLSGSDEGQNDGAGDTVVKIVLGPGE
jgi:hexosaminidase